MYFNREKMLGMADYYRDSIWGFKTPKTVASLTDLKHSKDNSHSQPAGSRFFFNAGIGCTSSASKLGVVVLSES